MRIAKLALSVDVKAAVGGRPGPNASTPGTISPGLSWRTSRMRPGALACRGMVARGTRGAGRGNRRRRTYRLGKGPRRGPTRGRRRDRRRSGGRPEPGPFPDRARPGLGSRATTTSSSLAAPSADDVHAMFSCHQRVHVERRITLETRLPIRNAHWRSSASAFKPLLTAVVRQHRAPWGPGFRGEPALPAGPG